MVTHTRNLCSAFNPLKVHTHRNEHTHTHTHTVNTHLEQWAAISSAAPGEQLEVRCLAQGHLSHVLKVERALYIHCPHLQFLPVRDSNSQPFNYNSDSLSIRPRLPPSRANIEGSPQGANKAKLDFAKKKNCQDHFWKSILWTAEIKINLYQNDGNKKVWRRLRAAHDPKHKTSSVKHEAA